MSIEKRLDKISQSLTPKQSVILWLQELKGYHNVNEYIQFLKGQPDDEVPITKQTKLVAEAIRQDMRGQPKESINHTVRKAVRDVVFLIKLQHQVNLEIMLKVRNWRLSQIALAECLRNLHTELIFRNVISDVAAQVNFEMPYPLEPEVAASVESAIRNHVYTWEALEDSNIIHDWLWDYLVEKGAKELPLNANQYPDGQYQVNIIPSNEKEVRACFPDDTQFERFKSGEDFTHGLASVTDAEYNRHYETMVNAIEELVKSGQVQAGKIVRLEMIPIPFLQEAPLIDGVWLDSKVIELAEFGNLLKCLGHGVKEEDIPLLASKKYIRKDGTAVDSEELERLQHRAQLFLKKYSGRTKKIEGRSYIHFKDYCAWKGRKLKGDLASLVQSGIITSSWNKWVNSQGGEGKANLGGIPVGLLTCSVDDFSFYVSPQVDEALKRRQQVLDSISLWSFKPDRKESIIQGWKDSVSYCLMELYSYREAIKQIQDRFFEGQYVLFQDVSEELDSLITEAEKTVGNFNSSFHDLHNLFEPLELEVLRTKAAQQCTPILTYIVEMAKVEALDNLGDEDAARKIAERYI